jgi:hypothetical protein
MMMMMMMMMNIYSGNLLAKAIFSRDLVQYRKKCDNENYKDYIKLNLSLRPGGVRTGSAKHDGRK